jgi:predicted RNase H-like HicB family nuclease
VFRASNLGFQVCLAFGVWHSEFACHLDFEISNSASFDSVRWPTVQLKQRAVMLTEYIEAAMRKAKYEILSDDNSFYGYIPDFDGVYANADDLEACRIELKEVLEEWIMLGISRHLPLPIVDGIRLVVEEAV